MLYTSKKIHSHIGSAKGVLLVPHQNPDGDAIGSTGALAEYLRKHHNKEFGIFCATPLPENLKFIPHSHRVKNDEQIFQSGKFDTIIVVDSGDTQYAGIKKFIKNHPAKIVNIDHHPTNTKYGHFNLINSEASSTAEIIFDFFNHNGVKINKRMATAILAGIITDTGNFTNAATSKYSLDIASRLLELGANIRQINQWTLKNNSMGVLKLYSTFLKRLEYDSKKDMVYSYLTKKDYKKQGLTEKDVDGMANFMNNIGYAGIALFLKETEDGTVKGSLRTTKDNRDVSAIAKKMGGGGHQKAAGFTTKKDINSVLQEILTQNE